MGSQGLAARDSPKRGDSCSKRVNKIPFPHSFTRTHHQNGAWRTKTHHTSGRGAARLPKRDVGRTHTQAPRANRPPWALAPTAPHIPRPRPTGWRGDRGRERRTLPYPAYTVADAAKPTRDSARNPHSLHPPGVHSPTPHSTQGFPSPIDSRDRGVPDANHSLPRARHTGRACGTEPQPIGAACRDRNSAREVERLSTPNNGKRTPRFPSG